MNNVYDMPIYMADWVVRISRKNRQPRKAVVKNTIVKGFSKDEILGNPSYIRKVLNENFCKRDIKLSTVVDLVLTKELGYGIRE